MNGCERCFDLGYLHHRYSVKIGKDLREGKLPDISDMASFILTLGWAEGCGKSIPEAEKATSELIQAYHAKDLKAMREAFTRVAIAE